ncbi:MAG: hypothetical protein QNJ46_29475, partial [Leptolyngbyaceae cyanobacterium MO_188.B28]|nr:hypothetical protein [Leptolyngbyaceae cyanobacterium MO_188.B28]
LAPVHPSHKHRITALLNPLELYRPSREVAFLAGLLSGLSLNVAFLMSSGLTELWDLAGIVNQFARAWPATSLGSFLGLLFAELFVIGVIVLYLALILAFLIGFGVLPIAGAVGLQVQAAAFVSQGELSSKRYTTLGRLALLSLLMGLGFVTGCLLTPVPSTLSLLGVPPTVFPLFVLFWAVTFWLWLLPLKRLAKVLYSRHTGAQNPHRKRRFLTAVSIVALLPGFVTTSMAHVSLSVRMHSPDIVDVSGLEWMLFGLTLLGLGLQAAVWGMGWRWMKHCGWFKHLQCASCHTLVSESIGVDAICPTCQNPLFRWACMEQSISLPSPPPPSMPDQGPPPL